MGKIFDPFGVRLLAQFPLPVKSRIGFDVVPVFAERAIDIEQDHVFWTAAGRQDNARNRGIRRPRAQQHDSNLADFFIGEFQRIEQARQRHARRPLRVVMPNRNVAFFPQRIQHFVAIRLGNIF